MFQAFYGMTFNPFHKDIDVKHHFSSKDFGQVVHRLEYLKKIKGIALLTGEPGSGKSFTLRYFVQQLNPSLFKPIYLPLSTLTVMDFYRALALGLGHPPKFKKIDLFHQIQEAVISSAHRNITPVVIVDEAQFIKNAVLDDLRILLNFSMDSQNLAILILSGQSPLVTQLNRQHHEALRQRITLNYTFHGLEKTELKEYVTSQLKLVGVTDPLFTEDALELVYSTTNGLVRKINNLLTMALLIGSQKQVRTIDAELVYAAQQETDLTL
jgi:type II secretory pathway predicted ATPase ExeA